MVLAFAMKMMPKEQLGLSAKVSKDKTTQTRKRLHRISVFITGDT